MRLRGLLLCCLTWAALCARAEGNAAQTPAHPDPKAATKAAGVKDNAAKAAPGKSQSAPPQPEVQAAKSMVGALGAAIDAASADVDRLRTKKADLEDKLSHGADAREVSTQALNLLLTVSKLPAPKPETAPPEVHPKAGPMLPEAWQLWGLAILVALLSPLICVAGFAIGARHAVNSLRNSLREAGLL